MLKLLPKLLISFFVLFLLFGFLFALPISVYACPGGWDDRRVSGCSSLECADTPQTGWWTGFATYTYPDNSTCSQTEFFSDLQCKNIHTGDLPNACLSSCDANSDCASGAYCTGGEENVCGPKPERIGSWCQTWVCGVDCNNTTGCQPIPPFQNKTGKYTSTDQCNQKKTPENLCEGTIAFCKVSWSLSNNSPNPNTTVTATVDGIETNVGWNNVAYSENGGVSWNTNVNVVSTTIPRWSFGVSSGAAGSSHTLEFGLNNGNVPCTPSTNFITATPASTPTPPSPGSISVLAKCSDGRTYTGGGETCLDPNASAPFCAGRVTGSLDNLGNFTFTAPAAADHNVFVDPGSLLSNFSVSGTNPALSTYNATTGSFSPNSITFNLNCPTGTSTGTGPAPGGGGGGGGGGPKVDCNDRVDKSATINTTAYKDKNFDPTKWPEYKWTSENSNACFSSTSVEGASTENVLFLEKADEGEAKSPDFEQVLREILQKFGIKGEDMGSKGDKGSRGEEGQVLQATTAKTCTTSADCNDGNACTADSCVAVKTGCAKTDAEGDCIEDLFTNQCKSINEAYGTACGTSGNGGNLYCDGGGTCLDRLCKVGTDSECSDGNACTIDKCSSQGPCLETNPDTGECVRRSDIAACSQYSNQSPDFVCERNTSGNPTKLCSQSFNVTFTDSASPDAAQCNVAYVSCTDPKVSDTNCCGTTNIQGRSCQGSCGLNSDPFGTAPRLPGIIVHADGDKCGFSYTKITDGKGEADFFGVPTRLKDCTGGGAAKHCNFLNIEYKIWADIPTGAPFTKGVCYERSASSGSIINGTLRAVVQNGSRAECPRSMDSGPLARFGFNAGDNPICDSLRASPTTGDRPLTVRFTGAGHDPDGTIAAYGWDFDGDGKIDSVTSTSTPSFIYNKAGRFFPELFVRDNSGLYSVPNPACKGQVDVSCAKLKSDPPGPITMTVGESLRVTASGFNGDPNQLFWTSSDKNIVSIPGTERRCSGKDDCKTGFFGNPATLHAEKLGEATITIKDFGSQSGCGDQTLDIPVKVVIPGWFQTKDGDLWSSGDVISKIPQACVDSPQCTEELSLPGAGGYPGVAVHNGTTDFGKGKVSGKEWLAQSGYSGKRYDYAWFTNLAPPEVFTDTASVISDATVNGGDLISGFNKSGYVWRYRNGDLTVNGTANINDRKVILIVNGKVTLNGRITVDDGTGFFMLIAKGDIKVDPGVSHPNQPALEGLFITDGKFKTGTSSPTKDKELYIRGSVVGWSDIDLERDLQTDNTTKPGEFIEYAPDLIFTFPRELSRRGITWREVAP